MKKIGIIFILQILAIGLLFSSCTIEGVQNYIANSTSKSNVNTTSQTSQINTTVENKVDIADATSQIEIDLADNSNDFSVEENNANTTTQLNTTEENKINTTEEINVDTTDETSQNNTDNTTSYEIKSITDGFDYLEEDYKNGVNLNEYSNTHVVDVDLNCDGNAENLLIKFSAKLEQDGTVSPDGITYKEITFEINDALKTYSLDRCLTTSLYITDFNENDNYKDICVITGGRDISREFTIYRFNGTEIEEYTSFYGAFDILYYDGNGKIYYNDDGIEGNVNKYFDYDTGQSGNLESKLF